MADLWRDFWIRETGMGQQVAQLHDRYMMMMMMMMMMKKTKKKYYVTPQSSAVIQKTTVVRIVKQSMSLSRNPKTRHPAHKTPPADSRLTN
jgi:hypothetical protein